MAISVPGLRVGSGITLAVGLAIAGALVSDRQSPLYGKDPPKSAAAATADDGEALRLINSKLAEQWKANKITPSARATDYEFIRRVSLDIIGRIAKPEEIQRFFKDPPESRRRLLIERLLTTDEYVE